MSLVNDGTVVWEFVNIANSFTRNGSGGSTGNGGTGNSGTVGSVTFTTSDWVANGDNYELSIQAGYLPLTVLDSNNDSILFDVSDNKIVIGAPITGRYYYTTKE